MCVFVPRGAAELLDLFPGNFIYSLVPVQPVDGLRL